VVVMEVGGLGRLLLRTKCDKSVVLVFFFIHLSFAASPVRELLKPW
jgi:hypothetical protein